jgi:beta-glucosidase
VRREVFRGRQLEGDPVATAEVDRIVLHPYGGASADGVGPGNYSIRWTGKLRVPAAGCYSLITKADDGIRVWCGGQQVIDDWREHPPRTQSVELELSSGEVDVVVEHFHGRLGAVVELGFGPVVKQRTFRGADEVTEVAQQADVAIVCVGYGQSADTNSLGRAYRAAWPPQWARDAGIVESEDSDRPFALPDAQVQTLQLVTKANPRTIVVLSSGGGVDPEGWLDRIEALLWAGYPGQEGGTAVAEVLFGQTNPSGKLPFTFGRRFADYPSAPYYHRNDGGKTPYTEGLLVGYRGFDANGTEPQYPFGHGLSYTRFGYTALQVEPTSGGGARARFTLQNTGSYAGAEVAQLYVVPPPGNVTRAPRALAGFARIELEPGQSQLVELLLGPRSFACWTAAWTPAPGAYGIEVGGSSRRVALQATVRIGAGR